jgi:hypothetical protein
MNINPFLFDALFVITAVLFNLLVIGIYIAQAHEREHLVEIFGTLIIFLIFPFDLVFAGYLLNGRSLEILAALSVVFLYLMIELLLDFILKYDFRSRPIWHMAYILLFYATTFSLIYIAFAISNLAGYLVTATFWGVMGALVYLYRGKFKQISHSLIGQT